MLPLDEKRAIRLTKPWFFAALGQMGRLVDVSA
jgi:hypothetical protein